MDVPEGCPEQAGAGQDGARTGKQAPTYRARRQRGAQGHSRGRWPVGGASSGCCGRPAGPSRRWGGPKAAELPARTLAAVLGHPGAPAGTCFHRARRGVGKHGRVYASAGTRFSLARHPLATIGALPTRPRAAVSRPRAPRRGTIAPTRHQPRPLASWRACRLEGGRVALATGGLVRMPAKEGGRCRITDLPKASAMQRTPKLRTCTGKAVSRSAMRTNSLAKGGGLHPP